MRCFVKPLLLRRGSHEKKDSGSTALLGDSARKDADNVQVRNSTVLVTGAGRRLGRAIAVSLAEAGADLILHVHSSATADLVTQIQNLGRRVDVVAMDLAVPQAGEQLAREALQRVGPIDILVNSAAVFFPTPLAQLTAEEWRTMLRVNLIAGMTLAVTLGREMVTQGHGKIIQLGDWSGQRPVRQFLPYCVAKGGLHAATVALAKAFAPQVQVNELVLGPVLPPAEYESPALQVLSAQTPLQRIGQPEDVVRMVRFLIEQGDFITGASYTVDGGWLAQAPGGMTTSL